MKKLITTVITVLAMVTVQAQTVQFHFSNFAHAAYSYTLAKGDKQDTIAKGKLDAAGKAVITLPKTQKNYKGIAKFTLAAGGGIDLVVNNENFSVTGTETQISNENVKFTGSPENDFLNAMQQQKIILNKLAITATAVQVYKKEDALYAVFEKEKEQLGDAYRAQQTGIAQSPLCAARFCEAVNFLMGAGSTPEMTQEDLIKQYKPFIKDKLDFENLYTSGLWSPLIENWSQMMQYGLKDDTVWYEDTKAILARISNKTVYTAFADKMVGLFAKAGKDYMVSDLGKYIAASGKVEKPGNRLISAMNDLAIDAAAPALQTPAGKKTINKKTLLFFYESGCNNCENEIHQLLGNYPIVKDKGYEVITVAADMTKEAGEGHGHEFPWSENLCDYKGFKGENFLNYGIIGTPTFFTIDANNKITGRYAKLIDTGILN
ncbi:redoxin domain-containing protein [Flavobacterium bizetiae]|uniref:peroxiredoxin family protein n=1 Tax=Flavobacterium bizetiae TaxID=2704140 RepID=UPI0021E70011|nr:redoxin domain-containing protein [Flavobacterium bizetiae]UTN06423.1 redoxin domain-containing protein [Flavobacterium bizetiae]